MIIKIDDLLTKIRRSRAARRKANKEPEPLVCQVCRKEVELDDLEQGRAVYVRTQKGADTYYHAACVGVRAKDPGEDIPLF